MIPLILVVTACLCGGYAVWTRHLALRTSKRARIEHHRSIANFSMFGAETLLYRLALRAGPNARLVRAFDVDNSFTTTEEKTHRDFLNAAVGAIHSVDAARWEALSLKASAAMDAYVDLKTSRPGRRSDGGHGVLLAPLVRTACLAVVLEMLFPDAVRSAQVVNVPELDRAATLTNELWVHSKEEGPSTGAERLNGDDQGFDMSKKKTQLRRALGALLLPQAFEGPGPAANPLSLIMPAYETVWRVVLTIYVHTALVFANDETLGLLEAVREHAPRVLGSRSDEEKTLLAFSKEALRLYPPTKRIYRQSTQDGSKAVTADVEQLHHDVAIWGPDALTFRPARFLEQHEKGSQSQRMRGTQATPLDEHQRRAYMPFGVDKHECPAAHGFGQRIIVLLVAALVRRFGTKGSGLDVDFGRGLMGCGQTERLLPTGRMDMEDWVVKGGKIKH